jgi:hypothetical protein
MIAKVVNADGEMIGVHTTYLQVDGGAKAAIDPVRASLGPIGGGAVQLGRIEPERPLIVGEGIESTLSLMQLRGYRAGQHSVLLA